LFKKRTTGSGASEQREHIAPRKLKQRELDQRERQWLLRMEGSRKVWMADSHQIMKIPTPRAQRKGGQGATKCQGRSNKPARLN
jgi:hypothetical protein